MLSAAAVIVAGPALLVAGWLLLISNIGQGANDVWAAGHLILFVANAFWIPATLILREEAGASTPQVPWRVAIGLVVVGSLSIAGQLAIDLAAWVLTSDQGSLTAFFQSMRSKALLVTLFYVGGPPLLFLGLVVASIALGRARHAYSQWTRIITGGLVVVLVGALASFSYVILAGYLVALAGFVGLAWRLRAEGARAASPVTA